MLSPWLPALNHNEHLVYTEELIFLYELHTLNCSQPPILADTSHRSGAPAKASKVFLHLYEFCILQKHGNFYNS